MAVARHAAARAIVEPPPADAFVGFVDGPNRVVGRNIQRILV
jgi:hypothetical protein